MGVAFPHLAAQSYRHEDGPERTRTEDSVNGCLDAVSKDAIGIRGQKWLWKPSVRSTACV